MADSEVPQVVVVAHHDRDGVGGSAERTRGIAEGLEALGYKVHWFQLVPDTSIWARRPRQRWWFHRLTAEQRHDLERLLGRAEAVVAAYLPVAAALLPVLRADSRARRWIYAAENDEVAVAAASGLPAHLVAHTARLQDKVLAAYPESWVAGREDATRLASRFPENKVLELASGARGRPGRVQRPTSQGRTAFTFGSWGYPPNVAGLRQLLRASNVTGTLHLFGRIPSEFGAELARRELGSLELRQCGFANSIADMVATSGGPGVVPVWGGAGTKLRVVELAHRGVPIFAPTHAFEGLPDWVAAGAARVNDDPAELLEAAFSEDEDAWRRAELLADRVQAELSSDALVARVWKAGVV